MSRRQAASSAILTIAFRLAAIAVGCGGAAAAFAQQPAEPSPFPESSLQSIDPIEALPPPLDDEEPYFPNLRPQVEPPRPVETPPREPESLPSGGGGSGSDVGDEVVRQRYADGKVRVERHVALDDKENYVNHGPYRMFDPKGVVIAEGRFYYGRAEGPWRRWVTGAASNDLLNPPYSAFQAPFLSVASFREGKLHGVWMLNDRMQRKVFEIEFQQGQRHGRAAWYFPQGGLLREAFYAEGVPHGVQRIWKKPGVAPDNYRFEEGRRVELQTEFYPNRQKRSEGVYYHPQLTLKSQDDWWAMKLAEYEAAGAGYRHGQWRVWHANGQLQMRGDYERDQAAGQFSWWHPNGQLALQGGYFDGKRDGRWMWWHANGLKRSQGEYYDGNPTGEWAWWEEDGKLSRQADFPDRLRNLEEEFPVERPLGNPTTPAAHGSQDNRT